MRSLRGPGGAGRWASRRGRVSSDIFSTGLQGAVGLSCYRRRAPLRVTCRHARTATSDRLPQVATPEWVVGRGQFATDLGDNHELGGVIGGGLAISHATETDWLTHMSLSGLGVGDLGRRFDRLSVAILVVSVGLFVAAYPAHLVPYALMELICFASIGARIWLLAARLQHVTCQLSQRQSVTSQGSGARIGWPDVLGCTGAQPARDRLSIRRW